MNKNDIDYRQKYLKYKAKYLELQEQQGGIFNRKGKKDDKKEEIRFQNCAILKLSIRPTKENVTLNLIYSGEINPKKEEIYYISKTETKTETKPDKTYILCTHNTRLRCFVNEYFPLEINKKEDKINNKRVIFNERICTKKKLLINIDAQNLNADIYIIRHGEGTHNVSPYLKKKFNQAFGVYDTQLTHEGVQQAYKAGQNMSSQIDEIDGLFASKLNRTRLTLIKFLEGLKEIKLKEKKNINIPTEITIVPCSHELGKFHEKECDKNNKKNWVTPNENRSYCVCGKFDNKKCKKTEIQQDHELCKKTENYTLIWKDYNEHNNEHNNCNDTNMITEMIKIINKKTQ